MVLPHWQALEGGLVAQRQGQEPASLNLQDLEAQRQGQEAGLEVVPYLGSLEARPGLAAVVRSIAAALSPQSYQVAQYLDNVALPASCPSTRTTGTTRGSVLLLFGRPASTRPPPRGCPFGSNTDPPFPTSTCRNERVAHWVVYRPCARASAALR